MDQRQCEAAYQLSSRFLVRQLDLNTANFRSTDTHGHHIGRGMDRLLLIMKSVFPLG